MRTAILALLAAAPLLGAFQAETTEHVPHLLLSRQRLRRLQRDRERQTLRWLNFQAALEIDTGSSERGFELALFYAVTHDEKRGNEAIAWTLAHPCEIRQAALVLDWVADLIPDTRRAAIASACTAKSASTFSARDLLFLDVVTNKDPDRRISVTWPDILHSLENGAFRDPAVLYAATEYLIAVRGIAHDDLRQQAVQFFSLLPQEFLLSMKPGEVEHPDWMAHVAALGLVNLDPNLEGSQYLQGWVMESKQMLRNGAGAAYEFLWADPYLPGVGYQNLDPWVYDEIGRLFARSDWTLDACWLAISAHGVEQQSCPANWKQSPLVFGHLTLIPMTAQCVSIAPRKNNEAALLWQLQPQQPLAVTEQGGPHAVRADPAGLWRAPGNMGGKICAVR